VKRFLRYPLQRIYGNQANEEDEGRYSEKQPTEAELYILSHFEDMYAVCL
jgi:hypothetical protein